MREELQRVTVELAEKSAEVRQLEWTKGMLEISLKSGNKKVEMLLIQSSATTSKEALHREIKVLIDVLLQCISEGSYFQSVLFSVQESTVICGGGVSRV